MLGTIVIGAVAGTWINIRTGFTMTAEGADKPFLVLQDTLNGVFPNILSAVFVIFCWYLLTKRNMSPILCYAFISSYCFRWCISWFLRYRINLLMKGDFLCRAK